MPVKIVSLEGNIGSGKSTLLAKLQSHFEREENGGRKVVFLQEPVKEWDTITDKEGKTILQKFYEDQEKYSFSFQMMAYISRLALLKKTVEENPDAIILCERSLHTDKMVFAKMLYDDSKIEDVNYAIYLKWFDAFVKDYPLDGVIYLKTDPDVCSRRIEKRSRAGEEGIPFDYLDKCSYYHGQMVFELSKQINHKILDGNQDIKYKLNEWISVIDSFLSGI
jgi:deoxyadenosine/deoxycytidine kinase